MERAHTVHGRPLARTRGGLKPRRGGAPGVGGSPVLGDFRPEYRGVFFLREIGTRSREGRLPLAARFPPRPR